MLGLPSVVIEEKRPLRSGVGWPCNLSAPIEVRRPMIVLGIVLLIIAALVPKLAVLWGIGLIVLVVGLILAVLGTIGHAVGGRRHYY